MNSERWLPIPGFPGYEVSDQGRVISYKQKRPRIRKMTPNRVSGYPELTMYPPTGRARTLTAHRLVLLAFVGPLPTGMVTRHLDGNPTNNALENLTYGTQSENITDAVRHGRLGGGLHRRTHCPSGHAYTPENTTMTSRGYQRCRTCSRDEKRRVRAAAGAGFTRRGRPTKAERAARDAEIAALANTA